MTYTCAVDEKRCAKNPGIVSDCVIVDRLRFLDNGLTGQVKLDIGFWELFSLLFRCIPAINPHHCCSHASQFPKSCYFTGSPHDGDPVPQKQSPAVGDKPPE